MVKSHTFSHPALCMYTHISMHHVSQSLKVGSAPRAGKIIMGWDEPLNLWERGLLPNKYSQSNQPDSFCPKLNELRFYRGSLMGSNGAFSLYPFLIIVFSACIPNNCWGAKTCCSGTFCFMTVCSNNSLKLPCRILTVAVCSSFYWKNDHCRNNLCKMRL